MRVSSLSVFGVLIEAGSERVVAQVAAANEPLIVRLDDDASGAWQWSPVQANLGPLAFEV